MNKVAFFADHIAEWQAGTEGQMLLLASGLAKKGWVVPDCEISAVGKKKRGHSDGVCVGIPRDRVQGCGARTLALRIDVSSVFQQDLCDFQLPRSGSSVQGCPSEVESLANQLVRLCTFIQEKLHNFGLLVSKRQVQ